MTTLQSNKNISRRFTNIIIAIVMLLSPLTASVMLPQAAGAVANTSTTTETATNQITFTYDSPSVPWTVTEQETLQSWVAQVYPVIVDIIGEPAGTYTINIVHDPTHPYAGSYSTGSPAKIYLRNLDKAVLIHETVHAFRNQNILRLATWEEGMAMAVASEVLVRIGETTGFNYAHNYEYDTYYDSLVDNSGVQAGQIIGYGEKALTLLRYHMSGYAFGKIYIENPQFFKNFFAAVNANPAIGQDESLLISTAASLVNSVEGQPFLQWFAAQGIFNSNPPAGCAIYQRVANSTVVDFFCREADGKEVPQEGASVSWNITGVNGEILNSGNGVTNNLGVYSINSYLPQHYPGRLTVNVTASSAMGTYSSTTYRQHGYYASGIFGVVTNTNTGSVTFTSTTNAFESFSIPVVDGVFWTPLLQNVRGTIVATFSGEGQTVTKTFTKDASAYSLMFRTVAPPANTVTVFYGNNQTAKINTQFANRLKVRVVNSAGQPVVGASVTFTAPPTTGATAKFNGALTATVLTNSNGVATAPVMKASGKVGSYTVTANQQGQTVQFSLKNIR